MEPIEIIIRAYDPEVDDAYIYSTWTKYAYYSPTHPITISKSKFMKEKINEIRNYLNNGHVGIACVKGSPAVIMGYIVTHHDQIKWLCIKKEYHKEGIDELLKNSIKEYLDGPKEDRSRD
jgi:predicted GTPase